MAFLADSSAASSDTIDSNFPQYLKFLVIVSSVLRYCCSSISCCVFHTSIEDGFPLDGDLEEYSLCA